MDAKLRKKWEDAGKRAESVDFDNIVLNDGSNAVRIVSLDFEEAFVHYIKDTDNETRRVVCPAGIKDEDRKEATEICPVCAEYSETKDSEIRPQHRYFFNAVQGEVTKVKKAGKTVSRITLGNTVKIFDIGNMIFKQIFAIQDDDEYPDVDKVNLKITRKGAKKKTEYIVMPSSKETPLPDDLTAMIDIAELAKITSADDINEMMGLETDEQTDIDDDEEEENAREKAKKDKAKKAKLKEEKEKAKAKEDAGEKEDEKEEESEEEELEELDELEEDE
jgi:hypothetical protein